MFKRNLKNYKRLFIITIVAFIALIVNTIAYPQSLAGYGAISSIVLFLLVGYHIYYYGKEVKLLKQEEEQKIDPTSKK